MVGLSPLSQTTNPWNPSLRRTWQTCQPICSTCYCTSRAMITPSVTIQVRKWPCLAHSLGSAPILDPTYCWTSPSTMLACPPERKEAFQQAFVSNPKMHALAKMIITGWTDNIKVVPYPLCPYWQHSWDPHHHRWPHPMWKSPHHASIRKAEGATTALPVPPRNHQSTVVCTCGCVFWPGINKTIEEAVQQCETCTWFQAQNAAAPLTPMPTLSHPWQICATDIFTLEGTNYLICSDFYSKMILVQHLPSGQSNTVKVISLLTEMFSEHVIPKVLCSDNVCKCTIHWVLHLLGYHTWDLKPTLSAIKWICWGMCKICEACTPMH